MDQSDARHRVAMQRALLSNLEREERGTRSALAQLRRSEVMLQLLEDDREVILDKVRRSPLPTLRHIRGCSILQHDDHPLSGFCLSVLRPSNWHSFKSGNIQKE